MKTALALAAACLFASSLLAAPKPSVISEYRGNYRGTAVLAGSGQAFPGTTTASFSTSKKKEVGTLTLTSIFASGGLNITVVHRLAIQKRQIQTLLASQFVSIPGSGSVKVRKKSIGYQGTVTAGGGTGTFFGKIKLTKSGLRVSETIALGSLVQTVSYELRSNKKRR